LPVDFSEVTVPKVSPLFDVGFWWHPHVGQGTVVPLRLRRGLVGVLKVIP